MTCGRLTRHHYHLLRAMWQAYERQLVHQGFDGSRWVAQRRGMGDDLVARVGRVVGTCHRRTFEHVPACTPPTRWELTPEGTRAFVLTNGVRSVVLPRPARRPAMARPPATRPSLEVLEGEAARAARDRAEVEAP